MHTSSLRNVEQFVKKYLDPSREYKILDVGSQQIVENIAASYKQFFSLPNWSYTGADMVPGINVDVIFKKVYNWREIPSNSYDCVVSGQAFEHIEFFWLTMLEIARVLKHDGVCCIVAPSAGPEHKYPLDCYRYYPDGLKAVARYAGLEVLEAYAEWNEELYPNMNPEWRDCVLIARKPPKAFKRDLKFFIKSNMIKLASKGANIPIKLDNNAVNISTTYQPPHIRIPTARLYFDTGKGFSEAEKIVVDDMHESYTY